MTKQKTNKSIVRLLGFQSRMSTKNGQKIIQNRRRKKRKKLTINV